MSSEIKINKSLSKAERYESLLLQIKSLISDENDLTANLGNICSVLKYSMDNFFWVGFYIKKGDELILGPFQGTIACTRIKIPNGVCGTCAKEKQTIIVDNVSSFPGHIACSSESKSEIVIPVFHKEEIFGVLDVDSEKYSNFDETDKKYLEEICTLVSELIGNTS